MLNPEKSATNEIRKYLEEEPKNAPLALNP